VIRKLEVAERGVVGEGIKKMEVGKMNIESS
jgi:hypothetical protein